MCFISTEHETSQISLRIKNDFSRPLDAILALLLLMKGAKTTKLMSAVNMKSQKKKTRASIHPINAPLVIPNLTRLLNQQPLGTMPAPPGKPPSFVQNYTSVVILHWNISFLFVIHILQKQNLFFQRSSLMRGNCPMSTSVQVSYRQLFSDKISQLSYRFYSKS